MSHPRKEREDGAPSAVGRFRVGQPPDEVFAFGLIDLIDRADVGMIEGGGGAGLALEAVDGLGIAGELRRKKFEGYEAAKFGVFSLVHHSHAAATELVDNAVVRDGPADH